MTRICEHPSACLHLRRAGGHTLDGVTVVREPCHLPLCRSCDDWVNITRAQIHAASVLQPTPLTVRRRSQLQ
jgi:hypothetical protein